MTSNTDTTKPAEGKEILIAGHSIKLKFQDLFPSKTQEEYNVLKEDIRRRGVLDKVVVWEQGLILLDGHHRAQIHEELGLEKDLEIEWQRFDDEESAKMWMLQHQVIRRNLNTFLRIEAILELDKFYSVRADAIKKTGKNHTQNLGEGGEVNEALGKLVKASAENVRKVKKIKKLAKPEEIDALRKGDVSIHSIYEKCMNREKAKENPPTKKSKPSPELSEKVDTALKNFEGTAKKSFKKTERSYFYDRLIKWAREKKAELTPQE